MEKFHELVCHGADGFYNERGRPPLLDDIAIKSVVNFVETKRKEQNAADEHELRTFMCNEMQNTMQRRGYQGAPVNACRNTLKSYEKVMKLVSVKGQLKTPARVRAEADIRNVYTMYAMCAAYTSASDEGMIFNWDATQYKIEETGETKLIYYADGTDNNPVTKGNT